MLIFMIIATGLSFLIVGIIWYEVKNKMALNLKYLGEHNQKDLELPWLKLIKFIYLFLLLVVNVVFWLAYLVYLN